MAVYPILRKARQVRGANIVLRDVTENDAGFILSLRSDQEKGRFLSPTSPRIQDQIEWLREYATSADQAYFVISDRSDNPLGCVRLYDPVGSSYCWGSWLMIKGLAPLVAIESAVLVYAYGKHLGFDHARLDVRRENTGVWKFHEKFFGADRIRETVTDYFYVMRGEKISIALTKYAHLIGSPLLVSD